MPRTAPSIALALFGMTVAPSAWAELSLDYDEYYERVQDLSEYPHLVLRVDVRDEDSGQPCAIDSVYLKLRSGTELLPQQAQGRLELPFREDWYDKGARILAKTAGGCEYSLELVQKTPAATELSYAELMAGLAEFRKLHAADAGLFSSPNLLGLRLRFVGEAKAELILHAQAGDKILVARDGWIDVPADEALLKEDPKLSLSTLPERILPWVE